MITAVDTSVLLDVLIENAPAAERSYRALARAREAGKVISCPVVWAEVSALMRSPGDMEALFEAGIEFDAFDRDVSELAGRMWHGYRKLGGTGTRLIADFLIAAHAQSRADALLSRDRGFTRRYFPDLRLVEP